MLSRRFVVVSIARSTGQGLLTVDVLVLNRFRRASFSRKRLGFFRPVAPVRMHLKIASGDSSARVGSNRHHVRIVIPPFDRGSEQPPHSSIARTCSGQRLAR